MNETKRARRQQVTAIYEALGRGEIADPKTARRLAKQLKTTGEMPEIVPPPVVMRVKTYESTASFSRASQRMVENGWELDKLTSPTSGRLTVTRLALVGPFALGAPKGRGQVTAVWVKRNT